MFVNCLKRIKWKKVAPCVVKLVMVYFVFIVNRKQLSNQPFQISIILFCSKSKQFTDEQRLKSCLHMSLTKPLLPQIDNNFNILSINLHFPKIVNQTILYRQINQRTLHRQFFISFRTTRYCQIL